MTGRLKSTTSARRRAGTPRAAQGSVFRVELISQIARNTGAARDILTARLRSLEDAGVIYRRQYQDHPPRFEYHLTGAGTGLRSVLNALRVWGDQWIVDRPPVVVTHSCGHKLDVIPVCAHCGNPVGAGDGGDWSESFVAPGWGRLGPTGSQR